MPAEFTFAFPLPDGLHARPASGLEEIARLYASEITLYNQRTGRKASAKSVLELVATDTRAGDPCRILLQGPDQELAARELSRFVSEILPHCDELPPAAAAGAGQPPLPQCLLQSPPEICRGTAVAAGIGCGRLRRFATAMVCLDSIANEKCNEAREKLRQALQAVDALYAVRLTQTANVATFQLLKAHRAMARDPALRQWLEGAVAAPGLSAAQAVVAAQDHFAGLFGACASELLRERAADVRDVCRQLLQALGVPAAAPETPPLAEDSIVLADNLTPAELLSLDRHYLKGLALGQTGPASHTAILARSFAIPCVTGIDLLEAARWEGQETVVDGELGLLARAVTGPARRYYDMEQRRLAGRLARLQQLAQKPGATRDGARLEIAANLSSAAEVPAAIAAGAESIGLFRTEMLFMDRAEPPDEEEQFHTYRGVLQQAGDRTVIIRTLDFGGDKPLPWLKLPAEANPLLGCRGVRLYPRIEAQFRAQLRALLRASVHGRLRIMIPMLTQVGEARWVKRVFLEERAHAAIHDSSVALGAMVEVPAAAFALTALARELDFFSIGSNDLLHYFTATDRAQGDTAGLCQPAAPAFLRLLKTIADDAHAGGKWIGLCGEMGGQTPFLPLLVGLGLDEISVSIRAIAPVKAELASLSAVECRRALAECLDCATAEEVLALAALRPVRQPAPLLDERMAIMCSDAASKAEAIKELCDALYVAGRTDLPHQVEEAVWQREAAYSTGFGHGFAIPHCKTDLVSANSLCVLKAQRAIRWSADDPPVKIVLLLVVRNSDKASEHLKVLARLARLLMHEEFRARLEAAETAAALIQLLANQAGFKEPED
jgi:fructose-specific PTS system IIA-like component